MTDPLSDMVPVVVVTGFLGAGKTTLLNELLSDPSFRDTAVVVNEFGDIAVDHNLVRVGSQDLVITTTGCLCCTASSDVRASLFELREASRAGHAPSFSRVVVETTGLADPTPIVNALTPGALPALRLGDQIVARGFRLARIVTCFDVITGELALKRAFEAVKQVAFASTIVLTKSDLAKDPASRRDIAQLRARLAAMNPSAEIIDRNDPGLSIESLFEGAYLPSDRMDDVTGWLALDRMLRSQDTRTRPAASSLHADDIRAISLIHDGPVTRAALDVFLGILSRTVGANLLRLKGLVRLADDPDRPMVVHAVQHLMHPPTRLSAWPDEDRRTRLVVIGRGHDERAVAEMFQALIGGDGGAGAVRPWRIPAFVVVFLLALSIGAAIVHSAGSNAVAAADHHVTSANGDRP
ncbi:MAG TPA: GTP-binding protein [Methylocella sp.]|nr:GTP-binding protein [Methylocella sp.]